jgi:hypothetical protein
MSTTFYAEMSPIIGHRVHCNCEDVAGETYGDYQDAGDRLVALREKQERLDGCTDEDCLYYGPYIQALEESPSPEINVTSVNARALLDVLGITREECPDLVGGEAPDAFLGRVLMAQAVNPADAGVPAAEVPGPGARFIDCGRDEGYIDERLGQLRTLAEFCVAEGREVVWA